MKGLLAYITAVETEITADPEQVQLSNVSVSCNPFSYSSLNTLEFQLYSFGVNQHLGEFTQKQHILFWYHVTDDQKR